MVLRAVDESLGVDTAWIHPLKRDGVRQDIDPVLVVTGFYLSECYYEGLDIGIVVVVSQPIGKSGHLSFSDYAFARFTLFESNWVPIWVFG